MSENQEPFWPQDSRTTYEVTLPLTDEQETALTKWVCKVASGGEMATVEELMKSIGVLKHG